VEDLDKLEENDKIVRGPDDLTENGHLIAKECQNYGIIGDYYLLGSKKSEFSYVAISRVEGFALKNTFIETKILRRFPGIKKYMLSVAFAGHIKNVRKPLTKIKRYAVELINASKPFCKLQTNDVLIDNAYVTNFAWNKQIDRNLDMTVADLIQQRHLLEDYKEYLEALN